jgi:ProP effector
MNAPIKPTKKAALAEGRRIAGRVRPILAERFPLAFRAHGSPKVPLKLKIDRDVIAACPDLTGKEINAAIADYCWGPRYWAASIEGATRVDLNGNPAGVVTAEQAGSAIERLAKFPYPLPAEFTPNPALRPGAPDIED